MSNDPKPVRDAVLEIGKLLEIGTDRVPFTSVFRPWMLITGLDLLDVVHLSWGTLWLHLRKVHDALSDVLELLTEDQLQEAACRLIGKVVVFDQQIDNEIACGVSLHWENGEWAFVMGNPTRIREARPTYKAALALLRTRFSA